MAKDTQTPFVDGLGSFKNLKFPGFNVESLGTSFQKNMEWMTEIQKIATQGTQSLLELETQNVQKALNHCSEHLNCSCLKAPIEVKTAHQAETAKIAVDELSQHMHDVNAIITQTSEQIMGAFQKRFKDGMDECSELVAKNKQ